MVRSHCDVRLHGFKPQLSTGYQFVLCVVFVDLYSLLDFASWGKMMACENVLDCFPVITTNMIPINRDVMGEL